jgi:hypothetical protein
MKTEMFGVRYFKDGKIKQKEFEKEDDARRFYAVASRRNQDAQLFRFWKESWFDAIRYWEMEFRGRKISVVQFVAFWLLAGIIVWGCFA